MIKLKLFITILFLVINNSLAKDYDDYIDGPIESEESTKTQISTDQNKEAIENRLAAQLYGVLEHYKQDDPVGFPNAPIPDPMDVPDMKKSLGMATLNMKKVKAHGLSKFRIKHVQTDLKGLKATMGIQLDEMNIKGAYTLSSFLSSANGPFTVTLKNVLVIANASLLVNRNGKLSTDSTNMDITFGDMAMDFQNLGFLGALFQGFVNSAPTLVFDAMKPFMLKEADSKIRNELDSNIKKLVGDHKFPNSISPLDMAISDARKKVREMGYDPFHIPNYNRTVGVFSMQMTNTWIGGCSSFYRVGEMIVGMENNTMEVRFQIGTQKIKGATQWEVGIGNGMITRIGHAQFTIQHIKVTLEIHQALDVRKKPQIHDLQIDLGNIQVRCDGAGTLDYITEFVVNVIPNILRYQIMDAIESPIKTRIQEKFNQIDVEKVIKENFGKFQEMGISNFKFNFENLEF